MPLIKSISHNLESNINCDFNQEFKNVLSAQQEFKPIFEEPITLEQETSVLSYIIGMASRVSSWFELPSTKLKKIYKKINDKDQLNTNFSEAEYAYACSCLTSSLVSKESTVLAIKIFYGLAKNCYQLDKSAIEKLIVLSKGVKKSIFRKLIDVSATTYAGVTLCYFMENQRTKIKEYLSESNKLILLNNIKKLIVQINKKINSDTNHDPNEINYHESLFLVLSGQAKLSKLFSQQNFDLIKSKALELDSESKVIKIAAMLALKSYLEEYSDTYRDKLIFTDGEIAALNQNNTEVDDQVNEIRNFSIYLKYLVAKIKKNDNLAQLFIEITGLLFCNKFASRAGIWLVDIAHEDSIIQLVNLDSNKKIDLLTNITRCLKSLEISIQLKTNLLIALGKIFSVVPRFIDKNNIENRDFLMALSDCIYEINYPLVEFINAKNMCLGLMPYMSSKVVFNLDKIIREIENDKLALNASYFLASTVYEYNKSQPYLNKIIEILYKVNTNESSNQVSINLFIAIKKILDSTCASLTQTNINHLSTIASKLDEYKVRVLLLNVFDAFLSKSEVNKKLVISGRFILHFALPLIQNESLVLSQLSCFVIKKYILHFASEIQNKKVFNKILDYVLACLSENKAGFHPYELMEELSKHKLNTHKLLVIFNIMSKRISSAEPDVEDISSRIIVNIAKKMDITNQIDLHPLLTVLPHTRKIISSRIIQAVAIILNKHINNNLEKNIDVLLKHLKKILTFPANHDEKTTLSALNILISVSDIKFKLGSMFLSDLIPLLKKSNLKRAVAIIYEKQLVLMQEDFHVEATGLVEFLKMLSSWYSTNRTETILGPSIKLVRKMSQRDFLETNSISLPPEIDCEISDADEFGLKLSESDSESENITKKSERNYAYFNITKNRDDSGIDQIELFHEIIGLSQDVEKAAKPFTDLKTEITAIRNKVKVREGINFKGIFARIIFLFNSVSQNTISKTPRYVQVIAVLSLLLSGKKLDSNEISGGCFAEIKTGEGKSIEICMLIVFSYLLESSDQFNADVITITKNLAVRDAEKYRLIYEAFGLTVASNHDAGYQSGVKPAYNSHIVYGEMKEFEFDYLRDRAEGLGTRGNRQFDRVIIDEADHLLMDEAENIAMLSSDISGLDSLTNIFGFIHAQLHEIIKESAADETAENIKLELISFTKKLAENKFPHLIYVPQHLREYAKQQATAWVNSVMTAVSECHYKTHYLIKSSMANGSTLTSSSDNGISNHQNTIVPVDHELTGSLQYGSSLSHGVQLALQFKHGLNTMPESLITKFISHYSYIKKYSADKLYGLSGTLGENETKAKLKALFQVELIDHIPTFVEKDFTAMSVHFSSDDQWQEDVVKSLKQIAEAGRPALLICEDVARAEAFSKILKLRCFNVIKEYITASDLEERVVVQQLVEPGVVIVATLNAGRGTHLEPSKPVINNNGMHVCLSFLPKGIRSQIQAEDRVARNGQPGSSQLILNRSHLEKDYGSQEPASSDEMFYKNILLLRNAHEAQKIVIKASITIQAQHAKDQLFEKFIDFKNFLANEYDGCSAGIVHLGNIIGLADLNSDELLGGVSEEIGIYKSWLSYFILKKYYYFKQEALLESWAIWLRENEIDTATANSTNSINHKIADLNHAFELFKTTHEESYKDGTIIENPMVWLQIGNYCEYQSKYKRYYLFKNILLKIALSFYNKAIKLDPKYCYMAYYNKISVLLLLQPAESLEQVKQCIDELSNLLDGPEGLIANNVYQLKLFFSLKNVQYAKEASRLFSDNLESQINNNIHVLAKLNQSLGLIKLSIDSAEVKMDLLTLPDSVKYTKISISKALEIIGAQETKKFKIILYNLKARQDLNNIHNISDLKIPKEATVSVVYDSKNFKIENGKSNKLISLLPAFRQEKVKSQKYSEPEKKLASDDKKEESPSFFQYGINAIYYTAKRVYDFGNALIDVPMQYGTSVYQNISGYTDELKYLEEIPLTLKMHKLSLVIAVITITNIKKVLTSNIALKISSKNEANLVLKINLLDKTESIEESNFSLGLLDELLTKLNKIESEIHLITIEFKNISQEFAMLILERNPLDVTLHFDNLTHAQATALSELSANLYENAAFHFSDLDADSAKELLATVVDKNDGFNIHSEPMSHFLQEICSSEFWLQQYYSNGYQYFLKDLREQNALPFRSMMLLAAMAAVEFSGGVASLFYAPTFASYLFSESFMSVARIGATYYFRDFSLSSTLKSKALSLGTRFFMGGFSGPEFAEPTLTQMSMPQQILVDSSDNVAVMLISAQSQYANLLSNAKIMLAQVQSSSSQVIANSNHVYMGPGIVSAANQPNVLSNTVHVGKGATEKLAGIVGTKAFEAVADGSADFFANSQKKEIKARIFSFIKAHLETSEWVSALDKIFLSDSFAFSQRKYLFQKLLSKIELCLVSLRSNMEIMDTFDEGLFLYFSHKLSLGIRELIAEIVTPEFQIIQRLINKHELVFSEDKTKETLIKKLKECQIINSQGEVSIDELKKYYVDNSSSKFSTPIHSKRKRRKLNLEKFNLNKKEIIDACFDYYVTFQLSHDHTICEQQRAHFYDLLNNRLTYFTVENYKHVYQIYGRAVASLVKGSIYSADHLLTHHHHGFFHHLTHEFLGDSTDHDYLRNETLMGFAFAAQKLFLKQVENNIKNDMAILNVGLSESAQQAFLVANESDIGRLNGKKGEIISRLSLVFYTASSNYFFQNYTNKIDGKNFDQDAEIKGACNQLKKHLYALIKELLDPLKIHERQESLAACINKISQGKFELSSENTADIFAVLAEYDELYKEVYKMESGFDFSKMVPVIKDCLNTSVDAYTLDPKDRLLKQGKINTMSYIFLTMFQGCFETSKLTIEALSDQQDKVIAIANGLKEILSKEQADLAVDRAKRTEIIKDAQVAIASSVTRITGALEELTNGWAATIENKKLAESRYGVIEEQVAKENIALDKSIEELRSKIKDLKSSYRKGEITEEEYNSDLKDHNEDLVKVKGRQALANRKIESALSDVERARNKYYEESLEIKSRALAEIAKLMKSNEKQFSVLTVLMGDQNQMNKSFSEIATKFVEVLDQAFIRFDKTANILAENNKGAMNEFINLFRDMVGIKKSTDLKPAAEEVLESNDTEGEVEEKSKKKSTGFNLFGKKTKENLSGNPNGIFNQTKTPQAEAKDQNFTLMHAAVWVNLMAGNDQANILIQKEENKPKGAMSTISLPEIGERGIKFSKYLNDVLAPFVSFNQLKLPEAIQDEDRMYDLPKLKAFLEKISPEFEVSFEAVKEKIVEMTPVESTAKAEV